MSKRIQLTIADPCHENWDAMTTAEKGRFCGSCQKQVIDFTGMSDSQLAAFFKKPSTGSTCGRFYGDQLDRSIEIPKKRIPWVKYFFQFVLPAFLVSVKAGAQGKTNPATITVPSSRCDQRLITGKLGPSRIEAQALVTKGEVAPSLQKPSELSGVILNSANDKPIPFATVMIKGKTTGVSADSSGKFRFDSIARENEMVLEVSSAGFKMNELSVSKDITTGLVIGLMPNADLAEVIIKSNQRSFMMGALRRVSVSWWKKEPVAEEKRLVPDAKVYPNPVQRNGRINIEFDNAQDERMQLLVVSMNGTVVFKNTENIRKGFNHISAKAETTWAAGVYIVQLRNERGEMIKKEKLIVQ